MATTDSKLPVSGQTLKSMGSGLYASESAADDNRIAQAAVQRNETPQVTDGGTAGTAATETVFLALPFPTGARVLGVSVSAPIGVTLNASNFATFLVASRNSAGANPLNIATLSTAATTLNAFAPTAAPLTVANVVVPAGGVLTVAVTKSGTGVAIATATAQCAVTVWFEEL